LTNGVGFATLKPSFPEASSHLVEQMRNTLRTAQEISVAVGEAERAADKAHAVVVATTEAETPAERRSAAAHMARLSAALAQRSADANRQADGDKSPRIASSGDKTLRSSQTTAPIRFNEATQLGTSVPKSSTSASISKQMTQEIETTVMWVQQFLESVHFMESDATLEPGASLLSIVQPRMRHQKDEAVQRSLTLFHEKKEDEEETDECTVHFRNQALQAVMAQRSQMASRE